MQNFRKKNYGTDSQKVGYRHKDGESTDKYKFIGPLHLGVNGHPTASLK